MEVLDHAYIKNNSALQITLKCDLSPAFLRNLTVYITDKVKIFSIVPEKVKIIKNETNCENEKFILELRYIPINQDFYQKNISSGTLFPMKFSGHFDKEKSVRISNADITKIATIFHTQDLHDSLFPKNEPFSYVLKDQHIEFEIEELKENCGLFHASFDACSNISCVEIIKKEDKEKTSKYKLSIEPRFYDKKNNTYYPLHPTQIFNFALDEILFDLKNLENSMKNSDDIFIKVLNINKTEKENLTHFKLEFNKVFDCLMQCFQYSFNKKTEHLGIVCIENTINQDKRILNFILKNTNEKQFRDLVLDTLSTLINIHTSIKKF